mgnify:CR=1 FL=1
MSVRAGCARRAVRYGRTEVAGANLGKNLRFSIAAGAKSVGMPPAGSLSALVAGGDRCAGAGRHGVCRRRAHLCPRGGAGVSARWRGCARKGACLWWFAGVGGRGCAEQAPMSARARRHGAARRCGPMGVVPRRVCFVPVALSARAVCVRVSFGLSEVQFGSRLEAHYFLGRDFDGLSV